MSSPADLRRSEEVARLDRARNSPELSTAEQFDLARDSSLDRVRAVATNPFLDPTVQLALMTHADLLVVVGLAQNPALVRPVVVTLAAHPNWIVRGALSENPTATPADDLPVSFLRSSTTLKAFLGKRLAEYDPSSVEALVDSWDGDVGELRCVLASFEPESREPQSCTHP